MGTVDFMSKIHITVTIFKAFTFDNYFEFQMNFQRCSVASIYSLGKFVNAFNQECTYLLATYIT